LWQQDGRLSVISDDGAVLEPYVSRRFVTLPLVVGKGAEIRARDFLALLARYPQVNEATKAAILVGERRWNLRLRDGLDIRLPENDVGNALAALSKLEKEDRLFSRDIVAVDMRLPDRLTVQLSEDRPRPARNCSRTRNRRKRPVTHDRPRSQPDAEDAPDAAEAYRAGGVARYRHQQDRLHDRAVEAVPAERRPARPNHAVELIGYSQIQSRGVKAGAVVDLAECEQAVRHAVALAERMAKVRVESVLLSVSGGRLHGQLVEAASDIKGGAVTSGRRQPHHLCRHAPRHRRGPHRAACAAGRLRARRRQGHSRPRGMGGAAIRRRYERRYRGCDGRQEPDAGGRALSSYVEAMAASPYVAGLSVLTDDEADIGAAVVEMGAGTTTIAIYSGGRFVMPADLRSAGITSPWISPAVSAHALQMPSESRRYMAPC